MSISVRLIKKLHELFCSSRGNKFTAWNLFNYTYILGTIMRISVFWIINCSPCTNDIYTKFLISQIHFYLFKGSFNKIWLNTKNCRYKSSSSHTGSDRKHSILKNADITTTFWIITKNITNCPHSYINCKKNCIFFIANHVRNTT